MAPGTSPKAIAVLLLMGSSALGLYAFQLHQSGEQLGVAGGRRTGASRLPCFSTCRS
jgi:hypothetical protein